jgi:nucleoid DNA-binding protein
VLKPRKAKTLIPDVASSLNISEDIVEKVISFYWQEVRKQLSVLGHTRVHLSNLGDFVIKHWKIDEKISTLHRFEENNKQKGLQQMTSRFKTAERLYELRNVKGLIEEEAQRAQFIRLHKKTRKK